MKPNSTAASKTPTQTCSSRSAPITTTTTILIATTLIATFSSE